MGHHLLVGRRTYESIGRPLPGRRMIVLSRQVPDRFTFPPEVTVAASLDEALDVARERGEDEAFVAGGAAVYEAALPRADRLYLTRVHGEIEGDLRFPSFDHEAWETVDREEHPASDDDEHATTFLVCERFRSEPP